MNTNDKLQEIQERVAIREAEAQKRIREYWNNLPESMAELRKVIKAASSNP